MAFWIPYNRYQHNRYQRLACFRCDYVLVTHSMPLNLFSKEIVMPEAAQIIYTKIDEAPNLATQS